MDANWIIIGIVLIAVILLVSFLIRKNQKDEREYEEFLKNDETNFLDDQDREDL